MKPNRLLNVVHLFVFAALTLGAIFSDNYLAANFGIFLILLVDLAAKQLETMKLQSEVIAQLETRCEVTEKKLIKELFLKLMKQRRE